MAMGTLAFVGHTRHIATNTASVVKEYARAPTVLWYAMTLDFPRGTLPYAHVKNLCKRAGYHLGSRNETNPFRIAQTVKPAAIWADNPAPSLAAAAATKSSETSDKTMCSHNKVFLSVTCVPFTATCAAVATDVLWSSTAALMSRKRPSQHSRRSTTNARPTPLAATSGAPNLSRLIFKLGSNRCANPRLGRTAARWHPPESCRPLGSCLFARYTKPTTRSEGERCWHALHARS